MSSIIIKRSAFSSFKKSYGSLCSIVDKCASDYIAHAEDENQQLDQRLFELERVLQELSEEQNIIYYKARSLEYRKDALGERIDDINNEIRYLYDHPDTVTETDSEGNSCTREVIDYNAIESLEYSRSEIKQELSECEYNFRRILDLKVQISTCISDITRDIYNVKSVISDNEQRIIEIKKRRARANDVIMYNDDYLDGISDLLEAYARLDRLR